MNYFDILTSIGIDLINFALDNFDSLVTFFIAPLSESIGILKGTEIGTYSLLGIMFGVGIPFYLIFVFIKFFADLIS